MLFSDLRFFAVFMAFVLSATSLSYCGGGHKTVSDSSPTSFYVHTVVDPFSYPLSYDGMMRLCEDQKKKAEAIIEGIASVPADGDHSKAMTWEQTFGALDTAIDLLSTAEGLPYLIGATHPDAEVRVVREKCTPLIDEFGSKILLRKDLYLVLNAFSENLQEPLPSNRRRFLDETLRSFRRNGLNLSESDQRTLIEVNDDLSKKSLAFNKNITDSRFSIMVPASSVSQLPESWKASNPPSEDGMVKITTDYPSFRPFIQFSDDFESIEKIYKKFYLRAADKNVELLSEVLGLRYKKAQLLGYDTWSDYVLEERMAKKPKVVSDYLNALYQASIPRADLDMAELREMKKKVRGREDIVERYESSGLRERVLKEKYGVDSREVQKYFEINSVREGIFKLTTKMYKVTYKEVTETVQRWHEDVRAWDVFDMARGEVIGRFFLDVFPRPNKYSHAAMFPIRKGIRLPDGSYQPPISSLVMNFPRASEESPSLLSHDQVTTFLHEFGHLIHSMFTTAELSSQSGTSVLRDFVEAPSQMFEEWGWAREPFDYLAKHFETGERMPDDLYNKLINSRTFYRGLGVRVQVYYGLIDFLFHSRPADFDNRKFIREIAKKYAPFPFPEGTEFQANFGHLIGYGSQYYGYQWALAICHDALSRFSSDGMLDESASMDWRYKVLAAGDEKDPSMLLKDFLGRLPNNDAYFSFLSVDSKR